MLITKGKWEIVLPSYPKNAQTLICVGDKLIATINNSQEVPSPESDRNAEAIVTAVNSTYGSMIDPLAVPDLLDCLQKMWDIAKDRWRALPATSHEKNVLSSTKAALEKAKLK